MLTNTYGDQFFLFSESDINSLEDDAIERM